MSLWLHDLMKGPRTATSLEGSEHTLYLPNYVIIPLKSTFLQGAHGGGGGEGEGEIGLEPLPSLRKSQKVGPVRKTLVVFMPPSCFSLNIIKTTYMICQVAQTIRLQNSSYMYGG